MPISISASGMWSVMARRANTEGKHVKSSTTTMISQIVISLPDGADRLRDQGALLALARPEGEQVPHPAAEVGTPEEHVGGERGQDRARHQLRGPEAGHAAFSSATFGLRATCW